MRSGGWPMWVVLLYGGIALVASGMFAARPEESKIAFIRAMSIATVFAIIGGVATCIAAVMSNVARDEALVKSDELVQVLMVGFGESMAPAILGFVLLSLVWVVTAAGVRRLARVG